MATSATPIGLASNASKPFRCGTCEYYKPGMYAGGGNCQNENPKLKGKHVQALWCCNLYNSETMKVILR